MISSQSFPHNLGFIFDSDMSFTDKINSVSKSCHFHIWDICQIHHLLSLSAATALANSLVTSKLDYCNSLYSGISQATNLIKLQHNQNSLAHHWLQYSKNYTGFQSKNRLQILFCLFTYKTITNQQPTYLHNSLSFPSHSFSTRSSDPFHMSDHHLAKGLSLSLVHDSGIHSLPIPEIRLLFTVLCQTISSIYRSKLQTDLFKIAFPP